MGFNYGNENGDDDFETEKLKKQNILNIYVIGNSKEINKSLNLEIMNGGYEGKNFAEKVDPSKYKWFPLDEKFSEELLNAIINMIVEKYKNQKEVNKISCNVILICLDYEKNERQKIELIILNCLENTRKIYKPIVILAYKNNNTPNDRENLNGEGKIESNNQKIIEQKEEKEYSEISMSIEEMDKNKKSEKEFHEAGNEAKLNLSDNNKYLELVHYTEDDYSEIEEKLYSLYCYIVILIILVIFILL